MTTPDPRTPQDRVMEHEYDGIKEYDNPMPRWWLMTFAGTVIFSIIYYFNVGPVGIGEGRIADYERDMKAFAAAHPAPTGGPSVEQLQALVANAGELETGKAAFVKNCVVCHRADGGGLIGPNLADEYWLHGSSLDSIYAVVANGVLEKGMPPWEKVLSPQDLARVVAYVASLRGTNPADPKPPQGVPVTP